MLRTVGQINPLSYGVDAMRQIALPAKLPAALVAAPGERRRRCHARGFFVVFLVPGVLLFSKQD